MTWQALSISPYLSVRFGSKEHVAHRRHARGVPERRVIENKHSNRYENSSQPVFKNLSLKTAYLAQNVLKLVQSSPSLCLASGHICDGHMCKKYNLNTDDELYSYQSMTYLQCECSCRCAPQTGGGGGGESISVECVSLIPPLPCERLIESCSFFEHRAHIRYVAALVDTENNT